MAELDRAVRAPVGFVAASTGPEGGNRKEPANEETVVPQNPDALDVDLDDI